MVVNSIWYGPTFKQEWKVHKVDKEKSSNGCPDSIDGKKPP